MIKTFWVSLVPYLCCLAIGFGINANAQQISSNEENEKHLPVSAFFSARQDFGSGVGYNYGYTTLEERAFSKFFNNLFPFLDFRAHRFLNDTYAANAGLGLRVLSEPWCKIFGINSYYDYRSTHHSHFNQLGLGLEILSRRWNIYLNGYLPVGQKRGLVCSSFQTSGSLFLNRKNYEIALKGLNLEGEVLVGKPSPLSIYALGGPYYYNGNQCRDVVGGMLGLSARFKQLLFLKITGTYDTVYKGRVQGTVGLTLPLGNLPKTRNRLKNCLLSEEILLDATKRNEMIVLDKRCSWKWNY